MVMFTDAAVKAIEDSLDAADILRIGAQGGGCSGLNYVIELAEKVSDDDIVINAGRVKVCLDKYSNFLLNETMIDYVTSLQESGFKFSNNKAASTCGCGTSFQPSAEDMAAYKTGKVPEMKVDCPSSGESCP
jgi:iron-sulfur cluster assembly accessory protein